MKAHGNEYLTLPQVTGRLAQLALDDFLNGPSDGRATERAAILMNITGLTGSADATSTLFGNAVYLGKMQAPVLPLEQETDIVRHNHGLRKNK